MDKYNLKPLVNNKPLWEDFCEMIDAKIEVAQRELEQHTKLEEIYRAQGKVKALRALKYLREEENGNGR